MSKDTRSRHWILTNNYKETEPIEDNQLMEHIKNINGLVFTVFQLERGEQGTLHHQIYLSFKNAERFSKIKKAFPNAHIEPAKGTPQQVYDYCTKEDTRVSPFHEWGELPQQGKRNDYKDIMEKLQDGATPFDIMLEYPSQYFRYESGITKAYSLIQKKTFGNKWRDINVVYLSDKAGSGKTRYVVEKYGYENVYRISDYNNPFDMYDGQKIIVFEEFRNDLKLKEMLHYLDGHPCELRARYANKVAAYDKVYIISNWRFEEQYRNHQEDDTPSYQAFKRRIHFIGNLEEIKKYDELLETPIMERPLVKDAIDLFGEDVVNIKY